MEGKYRVENTGDWVLVNTINSSNRRLFISIQDAVGLYVLVHGGNTICIDFGPQRIVIKHTQMM